jgi:conjugal transfer pilus assembly protein TraW
MRLAFVFLFHLFLLCPASSWDLGVFGETFVIAEKDLLEHIFSRLKVLQETGKLEMEQKKVTERIKEMISHPQPISGITPTQVRREYQFDPTITVTRDLTDHRGQVFAKKGEQFNPLDRISFSKPLLFIDGDDEKQVQWAVSKTKDTSIQGHEFSKVILVKGAPLELGKRLNREIYFDQHGVLTTKLGIEHVPAIVFHCRDLRLQASVAPRKPGAKALTVVEEVVSGEEK